jgi:tRNA A-37 threonylcarbamoyl transferase component Bud32
MSSPVGTLLGGRYRLDALVGRGGMSTVYRAFDTVLERQVAVKLMHREIASDSDHHERFRREARAVAQISHPHTVTVIDAGDDGDPTHPTPYIVFEYVDGETLKERIRRVGPLPISEAVAYAIEIARALECAHSLQIVHRDVKPQNVLVDSDGTAKITDFGIARTLTEEGLTLDGRVLGTTDYVSPEQALGHSVTGQSDIYSLGIVLYEMLTGEVPFRGDSPVAVAMKHVRETVPDVQGRRSHVSAALAAVVDRATAKDLARRYPDAASMEADLEEVLAIEAARSGEATGEATTVLRTLPGSARRRLPMRIRHPRRALAATIAVVAVAVAAVLYLAVLRTHRGTGVVPDAVAPAHLRPVPLGQSSAHDYNPYGSQPEHSDQVGLAVDSDPSTVWSTFHYVGDNLGKPGTGLYLDAKPGLDAKSIEIQTTTPGFGVEIYVAKQIKTLPFGATDSLASRGWGQPLAADASVHDHQHLRLDTAGQAFRYYLVWITKLPPNSQSASISELTLFK